MAALLIVTFGIAPFDEAVNLFVCEVVEAHQFVVDEFGLGLGTAAFHPFIDFRFAEAELLAVFVDGNGFLADPFVDGWACWVVRVISPEFVDVHPRVFGRCACCVKECADQGLETADFLFCSNTTVGIWSKLTFSSVRSIVLLFEG